MNKKTDFSQVVKELRDRGLSDQLIARTVGCSRQHIHLIRTGEVGSVSYEIGARLVKLREGFK